LNRKSPKGKNVSISGGIIGKAGILSRVLIGFDRVLTPGKAIISYQQQLWLIQRSKSRYPPRRGLNRAAEELLPVHTVGGQDDGIIILTNGFVLPPLGLITNLIEVFPFIEVIFTHSMPPGSGGDQDRNENAGTHTSKRQ